MKLKKLLIVMALLGFGTQINAQTNLIDNSSWSVGNGNVTGFFKFGTDAENIREVGLNPFGNSEVLWKAAPDASSNADGGWDTSYQTIDPSKDYRFTTWIKKTNSQDGFTLFGFHALNLSEAATSRNLDGTSISSPYFFYGDLPQLDEWYLLVGYVYGHGHTDFTNQGGIYDLNGVKMMGLTDFKMSTTTNWLVHRNYLFQDTNTADNQFFAQPTLYEIDGQEPTIAEIINPNGTGSGGGNWTTNANGIHFDGGNVGIGTNNPGVDKLAVNGNIRAKEVKVEVANWPDYVFTEKHKLLTLEEVQNHINEKGHLPNIPSAGEIEANGLEMGEINRLLIEKIEELTLYIIQQEKRIEKLELKK